MLIFDYKKIMTENRPFSWKILILGKYRPFGAVKDINIFGKLLDFLKAHIKGQLLVALPYHDSNFYFFAMAFTPP